MGYLLKKYFEACKAEVEQYGFMRKKKVFVRAVNDVVQIIAVENMKSYRELRVTFSVIPLCLRIEEDYVYWGAYSRELRKFELPDESLFVPGWEPNPPLDAWGYNPFSIVSMNECVEQAVHHIKKYLLPFFECANSCETTLPEIIKFEKLVADNSRKIRQLLGYEDLSSYDTELDLLDCVKYYIALKIGDYDFALRCRKALLAQNVDSYTAFLADKSKFMSLVEGGQLTGKDRILWNESLRRREEGIAQLKCEISKLEQRDEPYIQNLLSENESYSMDTLKKLKIIS